MRKEGRIAEPRRYFELQVKNFRGSRFSPEGIGLREQALGGKVPFDARITMLDKTKVHISAIRWLLPRCEERKDCVVVFKLLEDWEIKVFTDISAL